MVEVIVSLIIIGFVVLGFRDGLAKSLGSILMLFLALFASSVALSAIANISAEFGNPKSYLSIITFFLIWLVLYGVLDLLLKLLLKVVINITVLGPVDQFAGLLLGGIKGLLVMGIVLQFILSFPLPEKARSAILEAIPAKFSIAAFQWTYPAAKKFQPYFNDLIKSDSKGNFMDNLVLQKKVTEEVAPQLDQMKKDASDKILDRSSAFQKKLNDLLKDDNLKPTAPQGNPR